MGDEREIAVLAGGCFWIAEELLRRLDGVVSTRVGYTGGENEAPTEDHHPGHAEAVEVVFDPTRISYRELVGFFFQIHRPDLPARHVGSDYRSEIFCTSDEQRGIAQETIAAVDASGVWPGAVVTEVSDAGVFWEAEAEDQRYFERHPAGRHLHVDPPRVR